MIAIDRLKKEAEPFGIEITDEMAMRFDLYAKLLVEKNKVMNLTGITEPDAIVTRHFADSLSFFAAVKPERGACLIDIGSGAGFPGLAIKIARPDLNITLLDSTAKRVSFLSETAEALGLAVTCIHTRAEESAKKAEYRERFDFVTARAVSELRTLAEYCLGFVKIGGMFVALKGKDMHDERQLADRAIAVMGGKPEDCFHLSLADKSQRNIICIKKISHTPPKYPRVSAQIAKSPL